MIIKELPNFANLLLPKYKLNKQPTDFIIRFTNISFNPKAPRQKLPGSFWNLATFQPN